MIINVSLEPSVEVIMQGKLLCPIQLTVMLLNFVALLSLTHLVTAETPANLTDLNDIFRPVLSLESHIYLTNESSYDDVVPRWSTYKKPSYVATIKPASEEDVQSIVSTARGEKLKRTPSLTQITDQSRVVS